MKKRMLASFLSLALGLSLVPENAMAKESHQEVNSPVVTGEQTEVSPEPIVGAPVEQSESILERPTEELQEFTGAMAEEQLEKLIAALPDPANIDLLNEKQVEAVNDQILEIRAFAEQNGLNVENDETINAVIAALYPVELLANSISANGGELTTGSYTLNQDIQLSNNLTIPANANVTIDLNGHTLTGSSQGAVITVYGELTLNDSTATKQNDLINATEGTVKNSNGSWTVTYAVYDRDDHLTYRTYTSGAITGGNGAKGGGISVLGGTVTMNGGIITGNKTDINQQYALGAGIYLYQDDQSTSATFKMMDGAVSNNIAESTVQNGGQGSGGAIYVGPNCKFEMKSGVFCLNQALGVNANGGAAFIQGKFSAENAVISGNTSAHWTGGITGNNTTLTNCILVNNKTGDVKGSYGGAFSGGGTIQNSVISHNVATGEGGGLYLYGKDTTITNSVIQHNTSGSNGGGMSISSKKQTATINVNNSLITNNKVTSNITNQYIGGGGIYIGANNTVNLTDVEVSKNTVEGNQVLGGGISSSGDLLTIKGNSAITNNIATGTNESKGGGIFSGGPISIVGGLISNNQAMQGGGVYIGSSFSMKDGKVINNTAADCGGGLYAGGFSSNKENPTFSGSTIVNDNRSGTDASVVDNLTFTSTNSIFRARLSGSLTNDAKIGIRVTGGWIDDNNAILVDASENYQITEDDLSHIVYDGDQYLPYLDTTERTIKAAPAVILTFDSNTGQASQTMTQKVQKDKEIELAANTFVRDGYIFSGWSTTQNGNNGQEYADKGKITPNADTILYAQWIELTTSKVEMQYGDEKQLSEININGVILDQWTSVDPTIVKIENNKMIATGIGETTITANAALASRETLSVQVKVNPKQISVSMGDKTVNYNKQSHTIEATPAQGTTFPTDLELVYSYKQSTASYKQSTATDDPYIPIAPSHPGTYTVKVESKNPKYTLINKTTATLTISAPSQETDVCDAVVVNVPSLVYDGAEKAYTATHDQITDWAISYYDYEGKKLDAVPVHAGSYWVTLNGGNQGEKVYASITKSFTINPAALTIKADDQFIQVGDKLPKYTYTVIGLVNGEQLTKEPTLTCDTNGKTPGHYTIVVNNAAAGADYTINYVNGNLIVSRSSSGGSTQKLSKVYRAYNPNNGEHLYTLDEKEYKHVTSIGWQAEDVAFMAEEEKNGQALYRVYNPNSGLHHYTLDENEKNTLVSLGWHDEKVAWYTSKKPQSAPVFRVYNPNDGNHHYTMNQQEKDVLVSLGWHDEGLAFRIAPIETK